MSPIFVSRTVVVTKPLASGILHSTLPTFALKTGVVTKPLTSGIFSSKFQYFSPNFVYLCFIDSYELK